MKKSLLILLSSFLVIYVVNFFIPRLMPGDSSTYSSSNSGDDLLFDYSAEQKAQMEAYYGLDKPLPHQFIDTVVANLQGDFGQSIHFKRPVGDIIMERLPWSLYMMSTTLALSVLIAVGLALACVRNTWADKVIYPTLSALGEIPPFLVGIALLFLVAGNVSFIPLAGAMTPFAAYDTMWEKMGDIALHSLLPIASLCIVTVPPLFFTARASFLSVLSQPYLLCARSKGLSEGRIRRAYVLRNAMTPIIVRLFLSVGGVVGGTILVESVFAYPGLGTVLREAVKYRDYLLMQGVFLLSAVLVLLSIFLADMINLIMDKKAGGGL